MKADSSGDLHDPMRAVSEIEQLRNQLKAAHDLIQKREDDLQKKDIEISNIRFQRDQSHLENVANDLLPSSDSGDSAAQKTPDRKSAIQEVHRVECEDSAENFHA